MIRYKRGRLMHGGCARILPLDTLPKILASLYIMGKLIGIAKRRVIVISFLQIEDFFRKISINKQ